MIKTTNQGAAYVEIAPGQFVSAGKAASLAKADEEKAACNERVRRVVDTITQQNALPALVEKPQARRVRKGRVAIVVTIISYRPGELDEDNLIAGAKPLRDSIAKSLGLDDADKRLRFEYGQFQTRGATGTHVLISRIE